MLYTVGYRGWTIWRQNDREPFRISRTDARDLETLKRTDDGTHYRDFAAARREVEYLQPRT